MKSKHVVTVAKSGAIYIPKLTTKYLGIFGWAGVVITVEKTYIAMRFFRESITPKPDEFLVKLQKKSGGRQAMTGGCRKFVEAIKSDFGDANCLDLKFTLTVEPDEECVRINIDRPSIMKSTPDGEENADAVKDNITTEVLPVKDRQADICREIVKRKTCISISCSGSGGKFAGVECPLYSHGKCGSEGAEDWLVRNGYQPYPEESLGTVSKPAEQQLDIFDSSGQPASSTRTRPLPKGLPEWLRGPLSRGEQVLVKSTFTATTGKGWVVGAYETNNGLFVSLANCTNALVSEHAYCVGIEYIKKPPAATLKPSAECFSVAGNLGIGLSALQIKAINSGGVPPEGHGLPDEMFE